MSINYSSVMIANMALDEMPYTNIASLDDATAQARACRKWYYQAFTETLEQGNWGHARTRAPLTLVDDNDRAGEWLFCYEMPGDVAVTIRVLPPADEDGFILVQDPDTGQTVAHSLAHYTLPGFPFDFSGSRLYTSIENAQLEYVSNEASFVAAKALFVKALALNLASKLAMPLRQDRQLKNTLLNEAKLAVDDALAKNANNRTQSYGGSYVSDAALARDGSLMGDSLYGDPRWPRGY